MSKEGKRERSSEGIVLKERDVDGGKGTSTEGGNETKKELRKCLERV